MIDKKSLSDKFPDLHVSICIGLGILGFILAVALLTTGNNHKLNNVEYTAYGEIEISNKREIITELLLTRIKELKISLNNLEAKYLLISRKEPESTSFDDAAQDHNSHDYLSGIARLKHAIRNSVHELDSVQYAAIDTNLSAYSKYIFPTKKAYLDTINSSWKSDGSQIKEVEAMIIDTCRLIDPSIRADQRIKYEVRLKMKQNKRTTIIGFVRDYPQFGFWLVLSIAQMTMWFLLIPLLMGNLQNLQNKSSEKKDNFTIADAFHKSLLPFIVVGMFSYVFYMRIVDGDVINDGYFLTHYNFLLMIYAVFGYLAAIFCFGTYLSLAGEVAKIDDSNKKKVRAKNDVDLNKKFIDLKAAFDNSFLASALILSFYVLWAGVTINAVNNTEAIRFYQIMTAKPLIPSDLVYLMGIMHTCILLIFYLPVRLKFNSLNITKDPNSIDEAGNPVKKLFSTLSQSLGTILITASPLLASLVQKILEALSE